MAENKKSFILYSDLIFTLEKMTDDKAGVLFKTILRYVNDQNPLVDDILIDLVFEPIKLQMKRDLVKYEEKKKKFSDAGKASAEARRLAKIEEEKNSTTLNDVEKCSTFSTVNDNDNVTVNDTVTVIKKEKETKRFTPPSLLEVQDYITEKNYKVSAATFWNFYDSKNWYVGKNKMKNWKTAIGGWESRNNENNQNGKSNSSSATKQQYEFSVDRVIETYPSGS